MALDSSARTAAARNPPHPRRRSPASSRSTSRPASPGSGASPTFPLSPSGADRDEYRTVFFDEARCA
ncbi:MAG: hypothetical protein MZV63_14160 [Marinilabiliales bacterium]|nr:hypothetical protein [Marinilabiliales bacterium]